MARGGGGRRRRRFSGRLPDQLRWAPDGQPEGDQASHLNLSHSNASDISSYRTGAQLVSLGQVVCDDLESGASVQEVGDRVPLIEGNVSLPPGDLGVVISAAVSEVCPRFRSLL